MRSDVTRVLMNLRVAPPPAQEAAPAAPQKQTYLETHLDPDTADNEMTPDVVETADDPHAGPPLYQAEDDWSATARNAPCPCGSGKKYKHCHGSLVPSSQQV